MKNLSFARRLKFALRGVGTAFRMEKSFRTQLLGAAVALGILIFLRPGPLWTVLFCICIAGVLSAELFNTAIEIVLDHLHPDEHPRIGAAKDCAAGAVLIWSALSLVVFAALLFERFG